MNTTETPTGPTVAVSSTGMIHRAFVLGQGIRRSATAYCASNGRVGAKAVYLRQIHTLTEQERETGRLCSKCF